MKTRRIDLFFGITILAVMMAFLIFGCNQGLSSTDTPDNPGGEDNPFIVSNEQQLVMVGRGQANPAGFKDWTLSKHYKQTANITMTAPSEPGQGNWTRIGNNITPNNYFSGSYDGGGFTISGFEYHAAVALGGNNGEGHGFFGAVGAGGVVKNLTLKGNVLVTMTGSAGNQLRFTGGVVGVLRGGTVENVNFEGKIQAGAEDAQNNTTVQGRHVAGIVGYAYIAENSRVINCHVKNTIIIGYYNIGGVIGGLDDSASAVHSSLVSNCSYQPSATDYVKGAYRVGLVIGYIGNNGKAENLSSTGTIESNMINFSGTATFSDNNSLDATYGLVGRMGSDVEYTPGIFTVTFDSKGGSAVPPLTGVVYGTAISAPAPQPTNGDLIFIGWFKDEEFEDEWDFDNDRVTCNITLYAKWHELDGNGDIFGVVTHSADNTPIAGVTVTLKKGTETIATSAATNASGEYLIENVPQDEGYTLVFTPSGSPAFAVITTDTFVLADTELEKDQELYRIDIGSGTETDPFIVDNEALLRMVGRGNPTNKTTGIFDAGNRFRSTPNPLGYENWTLSAHYKQTADITLTQPWTRIGNQGGRSSASGNYDADPFTGVYDGAGKKIINLSYNGIFTHATATNHDDGHGFFGSIGTGAAVRNIEFVNASVVVTLTNGGLRHVGGVAGWAGGSAATTIENITFQGSVSATVTGDIALVNSTNTSTAVPVRIGGIVGLIDNGAKVKNCHFNGSVRGFSAVGGLVGLLNGAGAQISGSSYKGGTITGANNVGVLVGQIAANTTMSDSSFEGDVRDIIVNIGTGAVQDTAPTTGGPSAFTAPPLTTTASSTTNGGLDAGDAASGSNAGAMTNIYNGVHGAATVWTVTFNSGAGGSPVASIPDVPHGSTITAPGDPTHATDTFIGWFKDEELTDEWDFDNDRVTDNITLYAKWELIYNFRVFGVVTHSADDAPLAGVTVTLKQNGVTKGTDTTNTSGEYSIDDVENGDDFTLEFLKATYATIVIDPLDVNGDSIEKNQQLYRNDVGSGTSSDPYLVESELFLRMVGRGNPTNKTTGIFDAGNRFRSTPNPFGYENWTLSAHYKQMADITLTQPWTRIGNQAGRSTISGSYDADPFTGVYDGAGKKIINLSYDGSFTAAGTATNHDDGHGFFGSVGGTAGAEVRNIEFVNASVVVTLTNGGLRHVGGVAGWAGGSAATTIENITFQGSISATVTGDGDLVNSTNTSTAVQVRTGGIVGLIENGAKVKNCHFNGSVRGFSSVGGLVGHLNGTGAQISGSSYKGGTITGANNVGVLVGQIAANTTMSDSSFEGDVRDIIVNIGTGAVQATAPTTGGPSAFSAPPLATTVSSTTNGGLDAGDAASGANAGTMTNIYNGVHEPVGH